MKLSYRWLADWIKPPAMNAQLLERFTLAGLEVDNVSSVLDSVAHKLRGVRTAKVLEVAPHPNADRLNLCLLDTGHGQARVVCGAPNVEAGHVYAYAPPKSMLPNMTIEQREIRGEMSAGMLCSGHELGLGDYYGGNLLRLPKSLSLGKDLYQILELEDTVIEFDLTPNRGDCLSVFGLACEVASLYQMPYPKLKSISAPQKSNTTVAVKLSEPIGCPHYVARVIENIDVNAMTPPHIAERLRRCGMNAVNAVVDICNYVMLDLGQPMHAFDFDCLEGDIEVRRARSGESLELLDNTTAKLTSSDLLITDSKKPVAMAGLMGGANSCVTTDTKNILLESAWFHPNILAGRARIHGVHSDAAHRYERGVDPELAAHAMDSCVALLLACVGGRPGPVCRAISQKHFPQPVSINVNYNRIHKLLGLTLTKPEVASLLKRLHGQVRVNKTGWDVVPPSRRSDLVMEVDLIEEIARLHGYEHMPVQSPQGAIKFGKIPKHILDREIVADRLVALGYQEVVNYSLVPSKTESPLAGTVGLDNWVSKDMSALRGSLLPGLVENMARWERRQIQDLRLFEIGTCFDTSVSGKKDLERPQEHQRLALLMSGRRAPESWSHGSDLADIYDLKADVSTLLSLTGKHWDLSKPAIQTPSALLDARTCVVIPDVNGMMGMLGARWVRHWGLQNTPLLMELDLQCLQLNNLEYAPLSAEHPTLNRDLAIVVKDSIPEAQISNHIWEISKTSLASHTKGTDAVLETLVLFDVYQGDKILTQHRSMAYHLQFRHDNRALRDQEVDTVYQEIVTSLAQVFGAQIRDH